MRPFPGKHARLVPAEDECHGSCLQHDHECLGETACNDSSCICSSSTAFVLSVPPFSSNALRVVVSGHCVLPSSDCGLTRVLVETRCLDYADAGQQCKASVQCRGGSTCQQEVRQP